MIRTLLNIFFYKRASITVYLQSSFVAINTAFHSCLCSILPNKSKFTVNFEVILESGRSYKGTFIATCLRQSSEKQCPNCRARLYFTDKSQDYS